MRTRLTLALLIASSAFAAEVLPSVSIPSPPPISAPPLKLKSVNTPLSVPPLKAVVFPFSPPLEIVEVLGLIDLFGSVDRYRAAVYSARVEVVRLAPRSALSLHPDEYREGEPIPLTAVDAEMLKRGLLADSSYDWSAKETCECIPRYEFRVRFLTGDSAVACDVSLSERTLRVVEGDREIAAALFSKTAKPILAILEGKRKNG